MFTGIIEETAIVKELKRKETKINREKEFNSNSFSLENYMEDLKGYNIKIEL